MQDLADATRVDPGARVDLSDFKPAPSSAGRRGGARADTAKRAGADGGADEAYAEHRRAVLVVLQGMDASGKDGAVKHCLGTLNPMSVRVAGSKAPTSTEPRARLPLRIHQALPERGEIGIFNRSHYEDVLVVRVEELVPKPVWKYRYEAINDFEVHLANEGTTVVKCYLQDLRGRAGRALPRAPRRPGQELEVQRRRPREARQVGEYMNAYRAMLEKTSTTSAPGTSSGRPQVGARRGRDERS